jgi:hypothetical protein
MYFVNITVLNITVLNTREDSLMFIIMLVKAA